jgi:hypothetical protein
MRLRRLSYRLPAHLIAAVLLVTAGVPAFAEPMADGHTPPPVAPHRDFPPAAVEEARAQPPVAPHRDINPIVAFPSKLPPAVQAALSFDDEAQSANDDKSARIGYTRYAKKITRMHNDRSHRMSRSALMAANPEFSVIDCVANCAGPVGAIVYFQPRISTATGKPVTPGGIQTVALRTTADDAIITCLAGCYSTPKIYAAKPALPSAAQSAEAPAGIVPVAYAMTTSGEMAPSAARATSHRAKAARHQRRASLRKLRARMPAVWQTQTRVAAIKPDWVNAQTSFRPNYRASYRAY